MPVCDFAVDSYCAKLANLDAMLYGSGNPATGGLGQQFLDNMQQGYSQWNGCQWFVNRIAVWTNQVNNSVPITTGSGTPNQWRQVARRRAKIEWARCMLYTCAGTGCNNQPWIPSDFGCKDDGFRDQGYLNNQGTITNPQYGSVTPGSPALNYSALAAFDDGSCVYPPNPFPPYSQAGLCGCKDINSSNYDANATFDCDCNYISPFNINWTGYDSWGVSLNGSSTPSFPYQTGPGDTSCCQYPGSLEKSEIYDYRLQDWGNAGGIIISTRNPGGAIQAHAIGGQYLYVYMNKFDIVGNEIFNSPIDLATKGYAWPGTLTPQYTSTSIRIGIKVYSIEEQLLYWGTYSNPGSIGGCPNGPITGESCGAKLNNMTLVQELHNSNGPGSIIDLEPHSIWTNQYFPPFSGQWIRHDGGFGATPNATGPVGYVEFDWPLSGTTIDRNNSVPYGTHSIYPNIPSPLVNSFPPGSMGAVVFPGNRGTFGAAVMHWTGSKRVFTQLSPNNPQYSPFPGNWAAGQTGFTWPHSCTDCMIGQANINMTSHRNMIQYPLVQTASGSHPIGFEQDPYAWIPAHDGGWFSPGNPPFDSSTLAYCGPPLSIPLQGPNPSAKLAGTCLNGDGETSFSIKSTYIKDDNHEVTITPGININLTKK